MAQPEPVRIARIRPNPQQTTESVDNVVENDDTETHVTARIDEIDASIERIDRMGAGPDARYLVQVAKASGPGDPDWPRSR